MKQGIDGEMLNTWDAGLKSSAYMAIAAARWRLRFVDFGSAEGNLLSGFW